MRTANCVAFLAVALAAAAQENTGSVVGVVRTMSSGIGIGGVSITLRSLAAGTAGNQAVLTDAVGGFRFTGLKPGPYAISQQKDGYFATDSDDDRRPVNVGDRAVQVERTMAPWAKLSGRVVDAERQPVRGVRVALLPVSPYGGTIEGEDPVTDAEGHFEFVRLRSGTYTLFASPRRGQPLGRTTDPDDRREVVTTYFPGVSAAALAQTISIAPGSMMEGYDIELQSASVRAVRGLVLDESGKPAAGVRVWLSPPTGRGFGIGMRAGDSTQRQIRPGRTLQGSFGVERLSTTTQEDGGFEFPSVTAGEWEADAESQVGTAGEARGSGADWTSSRRGMERFVLSGRDVDRVEIRLAAPFAVPVTFDWGETEPADDSDMGMLVMDALESRPVPPVRISTKNDLIRGVFPGRYRVWTMPGKPTHYVDAILAGGRDVTNEPVLLGPGAALRVVMRQNPGAVTVSVENTTRCTGLIWPSTPVDNTVQAADCDAQGTFRVTGLRPGGYYAVVLDRTPDGLTIDELARLSTRATSVRVDEGATASVKLRLQPRQ